MTFTPASSDTIMAFGIVVIAVLVMFFLGFWYSTRKLLDNPVQMVARLGLYLVIWLGVFCWFAQSELLRTHLMPLFPIMILWVLGPVVWFCFSSWGARMALSLPVSFLIAFQIFRIPLEFILYSWGEQGTIPRTMTWDGQNFDLLTGLLALVVAPISGRIRWLAWTFNIMGLALLLNVMRVAIMSAPLPFAWGVQPPLQLAFYLPYALILPVCVGGALAGHLILTRTLLYH